MRGKDGMLRVRGRKGGEDPCVNTVRRSLMLSFLILYIHS